MRTVPESPCLVPVLRRFPNFVYYRQGGNLLQQGFDFLAVHAVHRQDAFQNHAMLYQAARPVVPFLVTLIVGEDRHAVLVLLRFTSCFRKVMMKLLILALGA